MRAAERDVLVAGEFDTPHGRAVSRQATWGEMVVAFERAPAGLDTADSFAALPGGRCPCPHWGYLLAGRVRVRYADREETLVAGDAYHLAPGHTLLVEEDATFLEFSPAEAHRALLAAAGR